MYLRSGCAEARYWDCKDVWRFAGSSVLAWGELDCSDTFLFIDGHDNASATQYSFTNHLKRKREIITKKRTFNIVIIKEKWKQMISSNLWWVFQLIDKLTWTSEPILIVSLKPPRAQSAATACLPIACSLASFLPLLLPFSKILSAYFPSWGMNIRARDRTLSESHSKKLYV